MGIVWGEEKEEENDLVILYILLLYIILYILKCYIFQKIKMNKKN